LHLFLGGITGNFKVGIKYILIATLTIGVDALHPLKILIKATVDTVKHIAHIFVIALEWPNIISHDYSPLFLRSTPAHMGRWEII
jgi:hypothetical protein